MNHRLAIIIFAFAFIVAIVAGFYSPTDTEKPSPSDFRAKIQEKLPNLPNLKSPLEKKKGDNGAKREPSSVEPKPAMTSAQSEEGLSEEAFSKKYGDTLKYSRYQGRVTTIDGTNVNPDALEATSRVPGFRPQSEEDLVARAAEILGDLKALLGMDANTSLNPPTVDPGDTTGRVTYQQAMNGVPVYPGGTVTILLGPRGEIRRMDSSVYPSVRVLNQASLAPPPNSRKVLYVTESEPVALLRYGYDSRAKGFQTITDAQTGDELFHRDRRVK